MDIELAEKILKLCKEISTEHLITELLLGFLKNKSNSAQKTSAQGTIKQQRQSVPRQNNQVQRMPQQQFNYQNTGYNNDQ